MIHVPRDLRTLHLIALATATALALVVAGIAGTLTNGA